MRIDNKKVVLMHYSVSDTEGNLIDSSFDDKPIHFIHGTGYVIKGLEEALLGKISGDTFEQLVVAEKAYGERYQTYVQEVPSSMFAGMDVQVGMQFRADTDQGEQSVIIVDVNDDMVTVDGNHPLAGLELVFEVEVLDVRDATQEELAQGSVVQCSQSCCH